MQSQIFLSGTTTQELLEAVRSIVRDEVQAIPKPDNLKTFLSINEVCELMDLSKQTVYTLTHKRQIPHIKRGGKLLFNRVELLAWLESSRQPIISAI